MGAGASLIASDDTSPAIQIEEPIKIVHLKNLPEAIEEALFVHEKFPLIIDPSEQASRFLKYQLGSFISFDDVGLFQQPNLNRCLVGAFSHGRTLTLKFKTLEGISEDKIFEKGSFPKELVNRSQFYLEENYKSVLKEELGDEVSDISISSEFAFIIVSVSEFIPSELRNIMHVIKVVDKIPENEAGAGGGGGDDMDAIANLYGAAEIVRNSIPLVEAAFDGELEEVIDWIEKGFYLDSNDLGKHSALSEASCQGHLHVVQYLIEAGADPNSANFNGRTPLWRASFNNHLEVVSALLEAGANPDCVDKVSMENAFDVAPSDEMRALLNGWDKNRTAILMEDRRLTVLSKIEERIKTSAEREQYARNKIRLELVQKAEAGDIDGIKEMLEMCALEAEKTNCRPRATAEVRNDSGQSLLSIATQNNNDELALFLLSYWKTIDKDRWDLNEGDISIEAKVFKTNPNSRDLKGWNCLCISVFHEATKVAPLLLEYGADPNMRSSYNKNAWDLAKDDLDAAENVVKSKIEIRTILQQFDRAKDSTIFGKSNVSYAGKEIDLYKDLDHDGSPIVMTIEMNKERDNKKDDAKQKKVTKPTTKKTGGNEVVKKPTKKK